MATDIQFPTVCALCETSPEVKAVSPGIGRICLPCQEFTLLAAEALAITPGIAPIPLPDGVRKNSKAGKPRRRNPKK